MPASIGIRDLFVKELSALLSAHQDSIEQSAEAATETTNPKLKRLFKAGADINRKQLKRVEKVFTSLRIEPESMENTVIEGIDEANSKLQSELAGAEEKDLARISMSQISIHYYISKYGTLRAYAQALGYDQAAGVFAQSLSENKEGDKQFSKVAEGIMKETYGAEFATEGVGPVRSLFRLLAVAGLAAAAMRAIQGEPAANAR